MLAKKKEEKEGGIRRDLKLKGRRSLRNTEGVALAHKPPAVRSICIICKQEKAGTPVLDDPYITTVRAIKGRLGIAAGNRLVVCRDDIPKYRQKRQRFERYLMWFAFLSFLLVAAFLIFSPSVIGFIYLLAGIVVIMLIPMLTYFPGIREEEQEKKG